MCDTFVVLPPQTADGAVIFGKNSDREPNEAQSLEFHPAAGHAPGATVQCTYMEIPQANETYAVLLSRPFWMWGAEMGANERGLVMGNEAVFTKMPVDKTSGLTGMDLLRLALERADTAENAVETLVALLADHGQGGICGYEEKRMGYHNSYIAADPNEAWLLETAGPLWAARRITTAYAISNGLTIGEDFDRSHPDLVDTAKKRGWLKKGDNFNFARCYSDWFYTTFSACRTRQETAEIYLGEHGESFHLPAAFSLLRDHGPGEYRPDSHFLGNRICAHAGNALARNATQTTASLVAHLSPEDRTFWATGTAAPCTGLFKPLWFESGGLPDIGPKPGALYDPETLWWHHEGLHRSVLTDHGRRLPAYGQERDRMEARWVADAKGVEEKDRQAFSAAAFADARSRTDQWIQQVRAIAPETRQGWIYRRYWEKQNRQAKMPAIF
ncbi:MAG: C69 family dipeptidase [Desulfobacterales bacterium]|nr:C69 family dipeptidase [Desulfobacterales bacterium]